MKAVDLREKSREELQGQLDESMQEYFKMKLNKEVNDLESPIALRHLRRNIARIKTVLNEKE